MAERKSPLKEEQICDVCGKPAERSVSGDSAVEAGLDVEEGLKRVRLCRDHYREWKKKTKKDRTIESLGR